MGLSEGLEIDFRLNVVGFELIEVKILINLKSIKINM